MDLKSFDNREKIPESVKVHKKRNEERIAFDIPDFVSVEFSLKGSEGVSKTYELVVLDCSTHGLGVLITKNDSYLIKQLNIGDDIKDITFYATGAMISVDGYVRHITEINDGKYKGCHILGVESPEIITSSMSKQD